MSTAVMSKYPVFADALKAGFWDKAESLDLSQDKLDTVRKFLENERYWKLLRDEITGSSDVQPDELAVQIAQKDHGIELTKCASDSDTLALIMEQYLSTQLPLHECVEVGLRRAGLL